MYEEEQIIEEVELTTEREIEEYVEEHEDRALYVPILPGLAEIWFFNADGHLAIVTNDMGDVSLAKPNGPETAITDDGSTATLQAIDLDDGPLTEEGLEVVAEDLADYHAE